MDGGHIRIASDSIGQSCTLSQHLATGGSCGATRTVLGNRDTRLPEVSPA